MSGSIQRRVSEITGKVTYRPRIKVGKRQAEAAGVDPGWRYGDTYSRLRPHGDEPCAERGLEELRARVAAELAGEERARTCDDALRDLAARWMRDEVRPTGRGNTVRAHERALADHILEVVVRVDSTPVRLGDLPAREIGAADASEWQAVQLTAGRLDGRPGGCGVKSVRNYRGTMHLFFEWLIATWPETFRANPVAAVKAPRWKRQAPVPPTLTVAQEYVAALKGARTEVRVSERGKRFGVRFEQSRFWPAVVIGSFTGMRRGEVLALRWRDAAWHTESMPDKSVRLVGGLTIDPRRGNLTGRTRETLRYGPPKTDAGGRYVPLPEEAIAALVELKAERHRHLLPGETWDDEALICCGRRGQAIVPDDLTHGLARTLRRRGLPPLNFHRLRHMVATEMRRAGVDRDVLADYLGHADPATTAIYDHVDEADRQQAAERFQEAWTRAAAANGVQSASNGPAADELAARRARK